MIAPRQLGRMLMGKGLDERRPRRPPLPQWIVPLNGSTHPAQGAFYMVEEEKAAPTPTVTIEVVDQEAAQALADEAKRLAVLR